MDRNRNICNLRNICFAAHVDAGKTSLAEQILFQTGAVRKIGRVDEGSSYFDSSPIEIRRGITIFSEYASVNWKDVKINLIDTPGHVDFVSELERSLSVADTVVIIISALDGIQQHTELIWELVQAKKIPALFFINKADHLDADLSGIFKQISETFTPDVHLLIDEYFSDWSSPKAELIEFLADRDDELLHRYLVDSPITASDLLNSVRKTINFCRFYPVLYGSAKTGQGVSNLLECIVNFMPASDRSAEENSGQASIKVFKVRNDDKLGRLAYAKVLSGVVNVRDSVINHQQEECKIAQIKTIIGNKQCVVEQLSAGDIGILSGLNDISAGDVLGSEALTLDETQVQRLLQTKVTPFNALEWPQLHKALLALNDEDPLLAYEWDPETKEMYINIMGQIHMEVLEEMIQARFGIKVTLSKPIVKYFETVSQTSRGFCHFEPKKHYAEVEVELEPNQRGQGNIFISAVSTDELPSQYQKAIEKAIPEALNHGSLIGNPVLDVKVKLIAGKHHLEHTHGGDFRIATIRAIQQALENNCNLLLEPVVSFRISVLKDLSGKVMSDIIKMKGDCNDPILENDYFMLTGKMPLATSLDYPLELTTSSGGKGHILTKPAGFQVCHNQDIILSEWNEDGEDTHADILYNSVSLFRAKRKMKKVVNDHS